MPDVLAVSARSIGDLLTTAAGRLHGLVPDPGREARALWAAAAETRVGDIWLQRGRVPADAAVARFCDALEQRLQGVPFAYATGHAAFRALDLLLDCRALIPRPETEGLVDLALQHARSGVAADLGTGSGCLALALAVEGSFERVVAVERDPGAAALARENVRRIAPPVPLDVREGDWCAPLAGAMYHVIVANPPYLTSAEYARLDPSVRDYEPRAALESGVDGLLATRAILATAAPYVAPGGALLLEIDERRAPAVQEIAGAHGWARTQIHADLFGRPRYAVVQPGEDD
ncbi:MAG TPA: peptide chain release factor N(5)-glutamine methyltransferase [Gemmatimonadales bacterium]|nr:peptide chain release factor N(5)-glutamine methyltransferase [Gemmatimonadales bacterium]